MTASKLQFSTGKDSKLAVQVARSQKLVKLRGFELTACTKPIFAEAILRGHPWLSFIITAVTCSVVAELSTINGDLSNRPNFAAFQ